MMRKKRAYDLHSSVGRTRPSSSSKAFVSENGWLAYCCENKTEFVSFVSPLPKLKGRLEIIHEDGRLRIMGDPKINCVLRKEMSCTSRWRSSVRTASSWWW